MIYKTLYRRLKIEQHDSHKKIKTNCVLRCSEMVDSSCFTSGTHCVTHVKILVLNEERIYWSQVLLQLYKAFGQKSMTLTTLPLMPLVHCTIQ
jgi:hypothetical protein